MTTSGTPSSRVASGCCPIPSRITFPPPNTTSSPYVVKSFSIWIIKSVSAKRMESPVVGPYISAYCFLVILKLITSNLFPQIHPLYCYIHIHAFLHRNPPIPLLFHLQAQNGPQHLMECSIVFQT